MISKSEKDVTMKRTFDTKRHRVRIKRKKQKKNDNMDCGGFIFYAISADCLLLR